MHEGRQSVARNQGPMFYGLGNRSREIRVPCFTRLRKDTVVNGRLVSQTLRKEK